LEGLRAWGRLDFLPKFEIRILTNLTHQLHEGRSTIIWSSVRYTKQRLKRLRSRKKPKGWGFKLELIDEVERIPIGEVKGEKANVMRTHTGRLIALDKEEGKEGSQER